jgi:hypothetical protein
MKVLNIIARLISRKNQRPFGKWSGWVLAPLVALAFSVASYLGLMFADVISEFVETINKVRSDAGLRTRHE